MIQLRQTMYPAVVALRFRSQEGQDASRSRPLAQLGCVGEAAPPDKVRLRTSIKSEIVTRLRQSIEASRLGRTALTETWHCPTFRRGALLVITRKEVIVESLTMSEPTHPHIESHARDYDEIESIVTVFTCLIRAL